MIRPVLENIVLSEPCHFECMYKSCTLVLSAYNFFVIAVRLAERWSDVTNLPYKYKLCRSFENYPVIVRMIICQNATQQGDIVSPV